MVTLKRIWNIITGIIVLIAVLLALLLVGVRAAGLKVYNVLSGSMEPTYHVGSLIYVKPASQDELAVGDAITYMVSEDIMVTHRIAELVPDEEDHTLIRYRTKGDANESADGGLVHYNNIIGKPVFSIPYLGYFADYIQKPPGMYVAISVACILIVLVFLPDLFIKTEKKKNN